MHDYSLKQQTLFKRPQNKNKNDVGHQWLMPLILTTQEAEVRKIMVRSQPGQIVHETLS
jgi:hypothetical protein